MCGERLIAVEQIVVLETDAETVVSGRGGAGVVRREERPPRLLVFHLDDGVDLVGLARGFEHDPRLLGGVLVENGQARERNGAKL